LGKKVGLFEGKEMGGGDRRRGGPWPSAGKGGANATGEKALKKKRRRFLRTVFSQRVRESRRSALLRETTPLPLPVFKKKTGKI